jgi:serine/threonine protein kinase
LLSDESLRKIADTFIGDTLNFYTYKSGSVIVEFFNNYFQFTDTYGKGFPSRWFYTVNALKRLWSTGKFDDFLTLILSQGYLQTELRCSKVEAIQKAEEILQELRKIVSLDGYIIAHCDDQYHLILENNDLELLGSGGFANVYKQKSTGLAVKKLRDDLIHDEGIRSRFKREYNITKSVQDIPGIIKVYDYNDNDCSYTMELAELTLETYCTSYDLDESSKIRCVRIILSIMKQVHERDIIHRDLSPNNIFIVQGQLKIADFGLGKDLYAIVSHQTMLTNAVGQYNYCAPEQFKSLKEADKKSDVYSLGRIINYIMTGNSNNYHHDFRSVTEKATSNNPVYRFDDAGELYSYFEKTIKYIQDGNLKKKSLTSIHRKELTDEVETFIQKLCARDLCSYLINREEGFSDILLEIMKESDDNALEIIEEVDSAYQDVCVKFESFDPIADFAYDVVGNYSFLVNEIACNILRYIAKRINRFHAQDLVESLLDRGIEPALEEILES